MMRAALIAPLLLTACVSSSRVHTLEKRIAEMEEREIKRELEVNGTLLRIEAQLAALSAAYARLGDLESGDSLLDKLMVIDKRLENIEKRGIGTAPPRPTRPVPNPKSVYAVPIGSAPFKGNRDALVTIVRAGEYACPFCERTRATMDELLRIYGSKLRVVNLDFVVHPQIATVPARLACAAHKQGKYWEYDELLWEQAFKARQFEPAHLEQLASGLGLDMDRLRADAEGPCVVQINGTMADLTALGVGATPSFFINGRFMSGAQPTASFQTLIDEELKLAEERVRKGTKRSRYYEEWVMKKGLTKLEPPTPATP